MQGTIFRALTMFAVVAAFMIPVPVLRAADTMKTLYSFTGGADGENPGWQPMIRDGKGGLIGVAYSGGEFGLGVVFELTPKSDGTWAETVIHSFAGGLDGAVPYAGLASDAAGNLYGMTTLGGGLGYCPVDGVNYFCGTAFELAPGREGHWVERVLFRFDWGTNTGGYPSQTPVLDKSGNLYASIPMGTGCGGGGCGSIFELVRPKKGPWKEKLLYNFSGEPDGADCLGPLVFDDAGNLYGTTISGGAYDDGTVFRLVPRKSGFWKETVLHSFDPANYDGGEPSGVLALDKQGNLYGAAPYGGKYDCDGYGCGVAYKLDHGTWDEDIIKYFKSPGGDYAGVAMDGQGSLYGTESDYPNPVIFRLVPRQRGGWEEQTVYQFDSKVGPNPGMVIPDGAGGFFGTTYVGGDYGYGSVFQIVP
jgi:uncharacterized repeat protein (TIGR03803 family)